MNAEVLRHMTSYEMQMHNVHQKADQNAGLHAPLASTQFQNLLKYFFTTQLLDNFHFRSSLITNVNFS